MSGDELPSFEQEVVYRLLTERLIKHLMERDGLQEFEKSCEELDRVRPDDEELEDSLITLCCSHCDSVVPGLYWTEIKMDWKCPQCGLKMKENGGSRQ